MLEQIAGRDEVDEPVVLVVAHPDDETAGFGSRIAAMRRLTIVHLTDGAPRDLEDARRQGFADWQSYAAARRRELDGGLQTLGVTDAMRRPYDLPDKESIHHLEAIVARLADDLAGAAAVVTHPYEHGHPDHDTAALAVALACRRLELAGHRAPEQLEFASYHLRDGQAVFNTFWPDLTRPSVRVAASASVWAARRAALACHASQPALAGAFADRPEHLRRAPRYDFTQPAPPGACLYDGFGWSMTSEHWRALARRALPAPHDGARADLRRSAPLARR